MDQSTINTLSEFIAVFTLLGDFVILVLLAILILKYMAKVRLEVINGVVQVIKDYGLIFAFAVAFFATTGSLFLSEAAKLPPCSLCWYQRVFMYPLAIILPIALLTNDFKARKYVIPLATIGALIALYNYILQLFPNILFCNDSLVACAEKYTVYFGYITIPMMSLTAFLLIILLTLFSRKTSDF